MTKLNTATMDEATFSGYCGSEMPKIITDVFDWFYLGEGKNVSKCYIRHLNGVKVTFEREDKV